MTNGKFEMKREKKNNRWVKIFCGIFAVGLAIGLGIILVKMVPKKMYEATYGRAISELENKNYKGALAYYNNLPYFDNEDTNTFYTNYITSLCDANRYIDAYSALTGNFLAGEALAVVDDNVIKEMNQYVQYREAGRLNGIKKYVDAYYKFLQTPGYKDSEQKATEILENQKDFFYNEAVENFEDMTSASVQKALNLFELIPDYEDSLKYVKKIQFMDNMCGTYEKTGFHDSGATYIIEYGMITRYKGDSKTVSRMHIAEYEDELYYVTDSPVTTRKLAFKYDDSVYSFGAYCWDSVQGKFDKLRWISSSTEQIKSPRIGMTAEEVEKSTWGKPTKINKTTYSWGTKEQWVYENYRYIYLENGKVTAIQE